MKLKIILFTLFVSCVVIAVIRLPYAYFSLAGAKIEHLEYFGQLGDFFGGVLNPFFALASLCALIYTISTQRIEFNKSFAHQKQAAEQAELQAEASAIEARKYYENSLAEARKQRAQDLHRDEYRFVTGMLMSGITRLDDLLFAAMEYRSINGYELYQNGGRYSTLFDYVRIIPFYAEAGPDSESENPLEVVFSALRHAHGISLKAHIHDPNYTFAVTCTGDRFIDEAEKLMIDVQTYSYLLDMLEIKTNDYKVAGANLQKAAKHLVTAFLLANTIFHGQNKIDTRFVPNHLEFPELYRLFMNGISFFKLPKDTILVN